MELLATAGVQRPEHSSECNLGFATEKYAQVTESKTGEQRLAIEKIFSHQHNASYGLVQMAAGLGPVDFFYRSEDIVL